MNWDQLEGNWKKWKGSVREKWGKLSDNDVEYVQGQREKLAGRLQERYGIAKDEAQRQINDWLSRLEPKDRPARGTGH